MEKHEIRELFMNTGLTLMNSAHPQKASGEVRKLQSQLYEVTDQSLQCLIFLLDLIVDDIFYNLSGDNGFNHKIYGVRDSVFRQVGKTLLDIGNQLTVDSNNAIIYETFRELTNVYLSQLQILNAGFHEQG